MRVRSAVTIAGLLLGLLGTIPATAVIRLGTLPDEPAPTIAEVLAGELADGEPLTLVAYPSVGELLAALQSGSLDAALLEQPMAPLTGISQISELYPSVLHMLHSGAAKPDTLDALLTSGSIYAGAPGGAGVRLLSALVRDYGLDAASIEVVLNVLSAEPDVFFIFGGLLAPDALQRLAGFQLWSLGETDSLMRGSVAESLMLRYPNLRPFVLPAEIYPTLGREAALTVALTTLLVARDDLADSRAFALAELTERARPLISAAYPLAGLPHLQTVQEAGVMLSVHPGAQRYMDRDQPGLLERYAEVLALGFSLIIALGSGSLAWERRRRQTRKDRLDGYFQAVLDARPDELADLDQRRSAYRLIRAIQSEVLELVIAERIEADGALVAFLSLSNQALAESRADGL